MTGAVFQQDSSRYCSHSLIIIARMAATAAVPTAAITVRGRGFNRAKRGESSGGACEEVFEPISGVSGGETADKSDAGVFRMSRFGVTGGGGGDSCVAGSSS